MIRINLNSCDLHQAAVRIKEVLEHPGAVVLVPTETVYGLIAVAGDRLAMQRISELKHRQAGKHYGWFIGDWRKLTDHGVLLDGWPEKLAGEFLPGALTIVAPCRNGGTQGFRVPDMPLLRAVLNICDGPLLQTSANASGMPDARSCDEALEQLCGTVDCAVDGGRIADDVSASTVVSALGGELKILRQGSVSLQKYL